MKKKKEKQETSKIHYVTPKDIEEINEVIFKSKNTWSFSWANIARQTGWSVTTVRKYYDEEWHPGKYYKKSVPATEIYYNCKPGIYLLVQQVVEDGKIINLVKVGQTKNINQRLNSYKGMNPFAKCVDILNCLPEELNDLERSYHVRLGAKNHRYGSTEWFICDNEEFELWSKFKFPKRNTL